jgi:hypothetical protein
MYERFFLAVDSICSDARFTPTCAPALLLLHRTSVHSCKGKSKVRAAASERYHRAVSERQAHGAQLNAQGSAKPNNHHLSSNAHEQPIQRPERGKSIAVW